MASNGEQIDRDQMLVTFQEVTDTEDTAFALEILERLNWDLEMAANHVFTYGHTLPQPIPSLTEDPGPIGTDLSADVASPDPISGGALRYLDTEGHRVTMTAGGSRPCDFQKGAATRSPRSRSRSPASPRRVPDFDDFGLQDFVASPASPINVNGTTQNTAQQPSTGISYLSSNISGSRPHEFRGTNPPTTSSFSATNQNQSRSILQNGSSQSKMINLEIETEDLQTRLPLSRVFTFSRHSIVLEVKSRATTEFLIPVGQQLWTGWPPSTDDSAVLSSLGLSNPHKLQLRKKQQSLNNLSSMPPPPFTSLTSSQSAAVRGSQPGRNRRNQTLPNGIPNTSSVLGELSSQRTDDDVLSSFLMEPSDILGADEEMEVDDSQSQQAILGAGQRLLEDSSADSLRSQEKLMLRFRERYGETHPIFYLGSFQEAVQNSCMLPASERKLLAIYAHHDRSVFANVFCETVLCSEHITNLLNNSFVLWGWDCTLDSNKKTFFSLLSSQFGPASTLELSRRSHKQYPILIFIGRQNGIFDILQVIGGGGNDVVSSSAVGPGATASTSGGPSGSAGRGGGTSLDEVASTMMNIQEQFFHAMEKEQAQERERASQQRLLSEQNQAYLESLAADRAKEEQRKADEREKKREDEKRLKKAEEKERKKEEQKNIFTQQLQPEPDPNTFKGDVTNVRIRTPSNETRSRKFDADAQLLQLFAYVATLGYLPDQFRIMTSWPRQELSYKEDSGKTFKEKSLTPTATLLIERKLN